MDSTISPTTLENTKIISEQTINQTNLDNEIITWANSSNDFLLHIFLGLLGVLLVSVLSLAFFIYLYRRRKRYSYIGFGRSTNSRHTDKS